MAVSKEHHGILWEYMSQSCNKLMREANSYTYMKRLDKLNPWTLRPLSHRARVELRSPAYPLRRTYAVHTQAYVTIRRGTQGGTWDGRKKLNMFNFRAVMVLKPKPKTEVLRWNRTATEPRFSGGNVTVFLKFQKWPSPVTHVPKQQPNYRLSRTPAITVWSDRLTARSGVARQPNYSPWQVDLCAAVAAVRTDAYIQVDSQPCRQICEWRGEIRLWHAHFMVTIHCSWRRRNT